MTNKDEVTASMELAVDWLAHSKIHNLSPESSKTFGSFNSYYDVIRKSCPHAHTEITGYAVELLIDLHEKTGNRKFLEDAESAATWIVGMQHQGKGESAFGSFSRSLSFADGQKSSKAFSFDAGICIGALTELYRKTSESSFLEAASQAAEWLISVMQNPDGSLRAVYDLRQGFRTSGKWYLPKSLRTRFSWFEQPGCYHCKNVIGLLKLHSVTGDDRLESASTRLCEWTMSQQDSEGGFPAYYQSKSVFAHTQCYAIEGLTYASEYLGRRDFSLAAEKGVSWIIKAQQSYGRVPDWLHGAKPSSTIDSSALAQALRILTLFEDSDLSDESASTILRDLLSMQCTGSRDRHALGGFYLTEYNARLMKIKLPRVYSWPTMFAIHSFILRDDESSRNPLNLW